MSQSHSHSQLMTQGIDEAGPRSHLKSHKENYNYGEIKGIN